MHRQGGARCSGGLRVCWAALQTDGAAGCSSGTAGLLPAGRHPQLPWQWRIDSSGAALLDRLHTELLLPHHPLQISSLEWSTSKLRGPHGPAHVLATAGMDGRVRLWAAPQKMV